MVPKVDPPSADPLAWTVFSGQSAPIDTMVRGEESTAQTSPSITHSIGHRPAGDTPFVQRSIRDNRTPDMQAVVVGKRTSVLGGAHRSVSICFGARGLGIRVQGVSGDGDGVRVRGR
jgi:hypothetical protein